MSQTRNLGRSSRTGIEYRVHSDNDGSVTLSRTTPTSVQKQIVDSCKHIRENQKRNALGVTHAVRIDVDLWNQWRREWLAGMDQYYSWDQYFIRNINSSDFKKLRTGSNGSSGHMKL